MEKAHLEQILKGPVLQKKDKPPSLPPILRFGFAENSRLRSQKPAFPQPSKPGLMASRELLHAALRFIESAALKAPKLDAPIRSFS